MLNASQIAFLRSNPDAQNVINHFRSNGWAASTDADINAIFQHWASFPAFQSEYGTLDNYLRVRGYGGATTPAPGNPPASGAPPAPGSTGDVVQQALAWAQGNPILTGIAALLVLKILKGK